MEKQTTRGKAREREMFGYVAAYETSGQTRQTFCEHHGLNLARFAYWRTKYLASKQVSDQDEPPGFVALVPDRIASGVEVYLGQVKLCFGPEVGMDTIADLVHKLSRAC